MSKVIDCFTFNGEYDLLEIRLNLLNEFVDEFVIVEATETFSGLPKSLYFKKERKRYAKWLHKIKYYVIDDYPNDKELSDLADHSPNVPAGMHWWHREFYQKESIKKAIAHLKDEDVVYISDVDEIWKPQVIDDGIYTLRQVMYSYYLNNRSSEEWTHAIVSRYKNIKDHTLNHLRARLHPLLEDGGWHFTNMGGAEMIKRKLEHYGHQEFNTEEVKGKLQERIDKNEDFIGRPTKFTFDESYLPSWLLDNRERYIDMFRNPLVSIIIPLYNYAHFLPETIISALNQTYKNIEIICVDDCSSDNSVEVANSFPVKVIKHKKNMGLAETRNTGIAAAKGEYILPLDSDDWIHKDFIRYTLALSTDIASTGQRQFGERNFVYQTPPVVTYDDFVRGNQINCCSLFKKSVWKAVGGYDPTAELEDWQFWLKATHAGFKVRVVQYPLFFYRIHKDSMLHKIKDHHKIGQEMIKKLGY